MVSYKAEYKNNAGYYNEKNRWQSIADNSLWRRERAIFKTTELILGDGIGFCFLSLNANILIKSPHMTL